MRFDCGLVQWPGVMVIRLRMMRLVLDAVDIKVSRRGPKACTLYRMKTPDHICPYGLKARHLLKKHGYELEDKFLRSRAETDTFKAEMVRSPTCHCQGQVTEWPEESFSNTGQEITK